MAHQFNFSSKFRRLNLNQSRVKQSGAALIILVFILAMLVVAYTLQATTSNAYKSERELKTAKALVDAKSALLGWSVMQNNPGQLPCPEDTTLIGSPTEGQAKSDCTSTAPVIGRLPWRTLGLGDIRDGNGDKLWYVISSGFLVAPINSNTIGQLSVDGVPNSAVAVIFSAGVPLLAQSRPTLNASDYLDGTNGDGNAIFVTKGVAGSFNDRLLLVTNTELFSLVTNRILRMVRGDSAQGLMQFYTAHANSYPFADANGDGVADPFILLGTPSYQAGPDSLLFEASALNTLQSNGWFPLISYSVPLTQQTVTLTLNGKTLVTP